MTDLQKTQTEYLDLNHAYTVLRGRTVSPELLLELLAVVEEAHAVYRREYQQTLFSAVLGI